MGSGEGKSYLHKTTVIYKQDQQIFLSCKVSPVIVNFPSIPNKLNDACRILTTHKRLNTINCFSEQRTVTLRHSASYSIVNLFKH